MRKLQCIDAVNQNRRHSPKPGAAAAAAAVSTKHPIPSSSAVVPSPRSIRCPSSPSMENPLESLVRYPMKLIDDIRQASKDVDSYKSDCDDLVSRVETLADSLQQVLSLIRHRKDRFCERPTQAIMEETSRTLDKCCVLLRKCKKRGFLRNVITIISSSEFKRAVALVDDALTNVNWLSESVTNKETCCVPLPPITTTFPNAAVIWTNLSQLQGGSAQLREDAAANLCSLTASSEKNGSFIIQEGGIPLMVKLLKDGTLKAKVHAAEALGRLAINEAQVRLEVENGVIPAFIAVLEHGYMEVQAKVAWALAEMADRDSKTKEDMGSAGIINHLVFLMRVTTDQKLPHIPPKKKGSFTSTSSGAQVWNNGSTSSDSSRDELVGVVNEVIVNKNEHIATNGTVPYVDTLSNHKEQSKESPELRKDLMVQVIKALWILATKSRLNCRRIAERRAMLGFAALMEAEQGDLQMNALKAVTALAEEAEDNPEFRKFAFKMSTPATKAVVTQLLRLIMEDGADTTIQILCIRAIGHIARTFSSKDNNDYNIIQSLVSRLNKFDEKHLYVVKEAISALSKFVGTENFLWKEHTTAILDALCLPYLVQLAVLDVKKAVQIPAIELLTQLALNAGRENGVAFQEAAAVSVLRSLVGIPISNQDVKEGISEAIHHLNFVIDITAESPTVIVD